MYTFHVVQYGDKSQIELLQSIVAQAANKCFNPHLGPSVWCPGWTIKSDSYKAIELQAFKEANRVQSLRQS